MAEPLARLRAGDHVVAPRLYRTCVSSSALGWACLQAVHTSFARPDMEVVDGVRLLPRGLLQTRGLLGRA